MSALDLDALERLTRAYADAHAAMLADDRSAQAWLDDEAASKALATHYGGQWASPAQCVDVLALITRLRAAEARTAWQPIETAPRDGTLVLAWHPHWGGPDAVRCSSRGQWTADWLPTCAPTHWMPLPAAPEAT